VATSFNLSVDRQGRVCKSGALTISRGPIHRSASAGGHVQTGRRGSSASAFSAGQTDRFGRVRGIVRASQQRSGRVLLHRGAPREVRRYRSYRR
jgi:hypothetical protein